MKDVLEYTEDELNQMSTEELQKLYFDAQMKEDEYHTAQLCKKVTINSLYGALGNTYFALFNPEIASAITMMGRYFNNLVGSNIESTLQNKVRYNKNYWIYSDTDSNYYTFEPFMKIFEQKNPNADMNEKLDFADKFTDKVIQPIIDYSVNQLSERFNAHNPSRIAAKKEIVADNVIFCAKKKYVGRIRIDEGTRFPLDNPHIKVMGLELAKSTTPIWVKAKLNEAIPYLLDKNESEIREWYNRIKAEFTKADLSEICMVGNANNLDYRLGEKGVPFGSRIAIIYNKYVKENNLTSRYPEISVGTKYKKLFINQPNKFGTECIAYLSDTFAENELKDLVDYDTQFEKAFTASINLMAKESLGIDFDKQTASLDDW